MDAMFVLRSPGTACGKYQNLPSQPCIDPTKAYDCTNHRLACSALWKVLKLYAVDSKLVPLLEDRHSGTSAALRVDGVVWDLPDCEVAPGVRHGCVLGSP